MWCYCVAVAAATRRTTSFFLLRYPRRAIQTSTTATTSTTAKANSFAAAVAIPTRTRHSFGASTTTTTNISMSSFTTTSHSEENGTAPSSSSTRSSWQQRPAALQKTFHFDTYTAALEFAREVNEMSTIMDHHANMNFTHYCRTGGVDLELTWFTYETQSLTHKDYLAARAVDLISTGDEKTNEICMNDYTYNLQESSIATFPATPRGSSKLLTVDPAGQVEYHDHFESVVARLLSNSLVVFNDSRVLDARLYIRHPNLGHNTTSNEKNKEVELMLLDLGDIPVDTAKCHDTPLRAMIRMETVQQGNVFTIVQPPPKESMKQSGDSDGGGGGGENGNSRDTEVQVKVVGIVG
jgi:pterin-4a-carbinolamine dehydratase